MEDGKMGDETIGLMVVMMGWMLVCWADSDGMDGSDDGMDGSDVISWSQGRALKPPLGIGVGG